MVARRSAEALRAWVGDRSDAIRVARVLCIVPMAYVHAPLDAHLAEGAAPLVAVLRDVLGRSSVMLLSALSGVLMVRVLASRPWPKAMLGRLRTLVVPLVVWNAVALGIWGAMGRPLPANLLNAISAVSDHGMLVALTFLRDLFVVATCTPVLIGLARRLGPWPILLLFAAGGFVSTKPVVAHSQIMAYYALGVGVGVLRLEDLPGVSLLRRLMVPALVLLSVASACRPMLGAPLTVLDTNAFDACVRRPVCAGSFWVLSTWLASRPRVRTVVRRHLEPAIYLMFLSHSLVLFGLAALATRAGFVHAPRYGLLWVAMPGICLGVAVLGRRVLQPLPGWVHGLVIGRSKSDVAPWETKPGSDAR
ncbi:MAG: acyltransferase family protein [Myxococcota bacterium]